MSTLNAYEGKFALLVPGKFLGNTLEEFTYQESAILQQENDLNQTSMII